MLVLNPTIQVVVVYLYTKYEHFILNGSGDIFDDKVLRNYRRMDGWKDRQMLTSIPPTFSKRGYQ